jgi:(p)ppGpp synthase/HD superfamily hydrolase
MARIKMRKKSYFSIFNKIKRKQNADFLDSIGVRLIFKDLEDLRKYEEVFEDKFVYSKKKDYILNPKKN